jgi:hypothetical protein
MHKMKQTLKITISPTKPKGVAYKLRPKKMPHPPSHMEKVVGQRWGLVNKINQPIATQKLTKKTPPIHSSREEGWGN